MSKHPIRKATGLLVLYSIIIIGIFVLQFRNESVILRNIGQLRMSVANTQEEDGSLTLKNSLQITFKGISFTADDVHPAKLTVNDSKKQKPLTLISWEQPSAQSFKFNFTFDTSLTFTVSDTSSKASLSVTAQLPPSGSSLDLYYKPVSGYSVTDRSKTRQLFSSKNISYTMSAAEIGDTNIKLTNASNVAMFTHYDPSKTFTFASIPSDSKKATSETFDANLKKYKALLLQSTSSALADASSVTENIVTAFVAESAQQLRYSKAIEEVPDSFKKGSRRTYLSAPYFNSLVSMNASLVMANENLADMIKNANAQKSIDIFALDNLADYILRTQNNESTKNLVQIPSSTENFAPNIAQATGIIRLYLKLASANSPLATNLVSSVETCLEKITSSCTLSSENLTLAEKDVPLTFAQTIETGCTLIDYGKFSGYSDYSSGGYMIVNTALESLASLDLRTLADVYQFLVPNNPYYPHSQILLAENSRTIWAWTCSPNISYTETKDEANISVSFRQGDSHYIILNGIKPFMGIEIYSLSFHTDPRFETYNSSGYVYDEKTQTLFLKSRHKVSNEKIRLIFGQKPAPTPIENSAPKALEETPTEGENSSSAQKLDSVSTSNEYTPIPESEEDEDD